MLCLEGLSVSYGQVQALREVSLEVRPGEIVAIVGANGAGKTTLLQAVSGLLPKAAGRVIFQDKDVSRRRPDELVRLGLGQVPEGRHIFPTLSVEDNLKMGAYLRSGKTRGEFESDRDQMFELFPILKERRRQKGGTLSGGEQQMLAIARALMGRPRLLMLDEPSMGLAPLLVRQIHDTIRKVNAQGLTVVLVEQEVEASLAMAGRGYVLQLGRLVMAGTGRELLADETVKAIYLGKQRTDLASGS
ncbi:MAG: ABC transporter ATP-binding protein [Thermodesulfobacteriota bacterium]